jgi:hypothetical protein
MPTAIGPIGRPHGAQASTPAIKHCLKATVHAADRLDDWIRRYVVEHPLRYRPTEFCTDQLQPAGGHAPSPAFSHVSASRVVRQSRTNRRPQNRAVPVRSRSAWLSAIGNSLKAEYDAAAVPLPSRLAALREFDRFAHEWYFFAFKQRFSDHRRSVPRAGPSPAVAFFERAAAHA